MTDNDSDEFTFASLDDDIIQEQLDKAEYVPFKDMYAINETRAAVGLPFLESRFGEYSREHVDTFSSLSGDDLVFIRNKLEQRLAAIHDDPELKSLYLQSLSASRPDGETMRSKKRELEKWVSGYLVDNGYFVGLENPQLFKALFMRSFPRLHDGMELTTDGVEDVLVNMDRMLNDHLEREIPSKRFRVLSNGGRGGKLHLH